MATVFDDSDRAINKNTKVTGVGDTQIHYISYLL